MKEGIRITLDTKRNAFVVRIDDKTILLPPKRFEALLESSLEAAAHHINAAYADLGVAPEKKEPIPVLTATGMEASADLGAITIVTKMHIGMMRINFASPRAVAVDYCSQVFRCIEAAEKAPPPQ